ncbi:unnamed protein product (macronuclear) [Paramecium tetraurelia]|uniref:Uncharacterized protein n=1 Tax=Paramecium tetraurelia TaxID=5888 RepID=A0DHF0_PARTE|nr:uncharacterized protein GSPATT00016854001 [Paramecium tetraurelia]CAK82467.1 unnamed protein product [Paramecium tetraurelia]|eukprot:XP_001449864.1 hypothetical protein (macronuclear) [Paramecium tetraurelia strain d4-2]
MIGTMNGLLMNLLLIVDKGRSASINDLCNWSNSMQPWVSSYLSISGKFSSFIFYLMKLKTQLRIYLNSHETYPYIRDIKLRVPFGDNKLVLQCLANFLIDNEESLIFRMSAFKFNKELAETFDQNYIHLMQKIVLPKLEKIALFQVESKDLYRGKPVIFRKSETPLSMQSTEVVKVTRSCRRQVINFLVQLQNTSQFQGGCFLQTISIIDQFFIVLLMKDYSTYLCNFLKFNILIIIQIHTIYLQLFLLSL